MFPKPVRRVILLLLMAIAAYYAYRAVYTHTRHEVITLKEYCVALIEKDKITGRKLSLDSEGLKPFLDRHERDEAMRGELQFIFYKIKEMDVSENGQSTRLKVRQTFRLNPPGTEGSSFWGKTKIINNIYVVLEKKKSSWKIKEYQDRFYEIKYGEN